MDEMSEVRGETNESNEPGTGKPAQTPQSLGDSDMHRKTVNAPPPRHDDNEPLTKGSSKRVMPQDPKTS